MDIALVDNDFLIHDLIQTIVKELGEQINMNIKLSSFMSAEDYLCRNLSIKYDLIILSIELPSISGIELVHILRREKKCPRIIYISDNTFSSKEAFAPQVLYYVLKKDIGNKLLTCIYSALYEINNVVLKTIEFYTDQGYVFIPSKEVVCIIYENRSPILYTSQNSYIIRNETVKSLYAKLSPRVFIKPNYGTIVNMRYISSISAKELTLESFPEMILISRGKYKYLMDAIREFYK